MSSKSTFNPKKQQASLKDLQAMFQNLQIAVRLMQMSIEKITETTVKNDKDVGRSMGVLNDLQYRTLAMMEILQVDKAQLDEVATRMKSEDFDKASAQEDSRKNFTHAEVTDADCDVVITSFCQAEEAKSIFRSRITLNDITDPKLKEKFVGLKVGDVTTMTLLGQEHAVEILGIRKAAPKVEEVAVTPVAEPAAMQPELQ